MTASLLLSMGYCCSSQLMKSVAVQALRQKISLVCEALHLRPPLCADESQLGSLLISLAVRPEGAVPETPALKVCLHCALPYLLLNSCSTQMQQWCCDAAERPAHSMAAMRRWPGDGSGKCGRLSGLWLASQQWAWLGMACIGYGMHSRQSSSSSSSKQNADHRLAASCSCRSGQMQLGRLASRNKSLCT